MNPHKHCELIKAWADGAQIEIKVKDFWDTVDNPSWDESYEYRIKPNEESERKMNENKKPLQLIRIEDVAKKTTLSKSTIWMKIANGDFIAPVKLGGVAVWKESDVDDWINVLFEAAKEK